MSPVPFIVVLLAGSADASESARAGPVAGSATVLVVEPPSSTELDRAVFADAVATYFADLNWSWVAATPPTDSDVRLWATRVALERPARFVVWWQQNDDTVLVSNVLDLEDPDASVDRTVLRLWRRGRKSLARTSLLRLRSAIRARVRGAAREPSPVAQPPRVEGPPDVPPPAPMPATGTGLELGVGVRFGPAWSSSLVGGTVGIWHQSGSWYFGLAAGMDLPEVVEPPGVVAKVRRFRAVGHANYRLSWRVGPIAWLLQGRLGVNVVVVDARNDEGAEALSFEPIPLVGLGCWAAMAQRVQIGVWGDLFLLRREVRVTGRRVYSSGYGALFSGVRLRVGS